MTGHELIRALLSLDEDELDKKIVCIHSSSGRTFAITTIGHNDDPSVDKANVPFWLTKF